MSSVIYTGLRYTSCTSLYTFPFKNRGKLYLLVLSHCVEIKWSLSLGVKKSYPRVHSSTLSLKGHRHAERNFSLSFCLPYCLNFDMSSYEEQHKGHHINHLSKYNLTVTQREERSDVNNVHLSFQNIRYYVHMTFMSI